MKGGIVIFAAGNDGISDPVFPGAYEKVVAVASLGIDGRKVAGSNYGSWIDLAALGGHATGDERFRVFSTTTNGGYGYSAGTSMARHRFRALRPWLSPHSACKDRGSPAINCGKCLWVRGESSLRKRSIPSNAGMLGNGLSVVGGKAHRG